MLSKKDISLIKFFKDKILELKYGRRIEYQLTDDDDLLSNNDHTICIHRLDDNNFVVKLTYKLSAEQISAIGELEQKIG